MAEASDDLKGALWTANRLGVSKRSVYRLVKDGAIPFYRVGRAIRFRPSEIDAWLQQQHSMAVAG